MKKLLVLIVLVLVLVLVLSACGSSEPTPTVTVTATPTAPLFTTEEQEIIDYCSDNIDELDDLVTEINVVLESADYATYNQMSADTLKLVKRYKRLESSYSRTNGGDYAGGKVDRLETLWEEVGNNIRVTVRALAQCLVNPDAVNATRAAKALTNAEETIPEIEDELDSLTSY